MEVPERRLKPIMRHPFSCSVHRLYSVLSEKIVRSAPTLYVLCIFEGSQKGRHLEISKSDDAIILPLDPLHPILSLTSSPIPPFTFLLLSMIPRSTRIPLLKLRLQTQILARTYAQSARKSGNSTMSDELYNVKYETTDVKSVPNPLGEGQHIK